MRARATMSKSLSPRGSPCAIRRQRRSQPAESPVATPEPDAIVLVSGAGHDVADVTALHLPSRRQQGGNLRR
jgi:hypothetical protein